MMRIALLGKRVSARATSGQRFGSAAAPANAAINIRRDVRQRSIEHPPEFEDGDLQQFYQAVGPTASGTRTERRAWGALKTITSRQDSRRTNARARRASRS